MSIVYDYLKKIRDQKETKTVEAKAPPTPKSSGSSFLGKFAVGVLGCLLIGAGYFYFFPKIKKTVTKLQSVPAQPRPAQTAVPDFNFLLEGIIYNPSKPFAIIDGKMYETGGRFGDFEVTQITPDTVSLKNLKDDTSHTAHL